MVPTTWDRALVRAAELLNTGGGLLASQNLSNEALWVLERLGQRVPGALWPAAGQLWPVRGKIENLARCKTIVLVGLDAWTDLPVLALWMRKAVVAGAKLIVLGPRNGLSQTRGSWLRGEPLALAQQLTRLIDSKGAPGADPSLAEAAAGIVAGQPAALLAHPSLVATGRAQLEALAAAIGARGDDGLVGAPLLGANGRGAQELAPAIARADADQILTSKPLLVIGDEPWAEGHAGSFARLILATSQPGPDDARIDVVLPMSHPYERQASITNLEGRVQHQEGGAAPPIHARSDWSIATALAEALGIGLSASIGIESVRGRIAAEHPSLADIVREEPLLARV